MILESLEKKSEDAMFEIFADLHPIEAFDLDKTKFCNYVRKRANCSNATDDEIEKLINQMRSE